MLMPEQKTRPFSQVQQSPPTDPVLHGLCLAQNSHFFAADTDLFLAKNYMVGQISQRHSGIFNKGQELSPQ